MKYIEQFQKGYKPPFQEQSNAPGLQGKLDPQPLNDVTADGKPYKSANKLEGQAAIVTGGDSGIGRATALLFGESMYAYHAISWRLKRHPALEGADITVTFTAKEREEAKAAEEEIKKRTNGKVKIQTLELDLRKEEQCIILVEKHLAFHGRLDALHVFSFNELVHPLISVKRSEPRHAKCQCLSAYSFNRTMAQYLRHQYTLVLLHLQGQAFGVLYPRLSQTNAYTHRQLSPTCQTVQR